ncbi:MAG: rRNA-binding ribosome biosynthesis protein utp25 [Vezdaea aestivalis]|nr:MAG: rRNA-binding ribosome biosynthesis protein utp25 [Vezdaea aestivalis]
MAPFRGKRRGGGSFGNRSHYKKHGGAAGLKPADATFEKKLHGKDFDKVEEQPSEDEESEEDDTSRVRPYNALLDQLKARKSANGRSSKKRKLNGAEVLREPLQNDKKQPNLVFDPTDGLEPGSKGVDAVLDEPEGSVMDDDGSLGSESEPEQVAADTVKPDLFEAHQSVSDSLVLARRLAAAEDAPWSYTIIDKVENKAVTQREDIIKHSHPYAQSQQDMRHLSLRGSTPVGLSSVKLKKKVIEQATRWNIDLKAVSPVLRMGLFDYRDVIFPCRTVENAILAQQLTCIQCLNHVISNRDKILKNNTRLAHSENGELELRDRGFTRPRVLFLLPTRQACARIVKLISALYGAEQEENKKRFEKSFTSADEIFSEDKPLDFRDLFGGNDDDMFRIGLKFTRKTMKYFSPFYTSDIILASPLGLKLAIGSDDVKDYDYDFLSSIEIVVIDQADALLMQNWEHVETIFEHLNLVPKESHGCDFNRVKHWYLDGKARYLRQTIILSAFQTPELKRLVNTQTKNLDGRLELCPKFDGAILDFQIRIKQTFVRFEATTPLDDPTARFNQFTSAIVPSIVRLASANKSNKAGILIFIPSYLDFVRIRNYFTTSTATQNIPFGSISEYSEVPEMTRARSHFFTGQNSVLLYTERAHHFRRFQIRGVKHIFMFGLPENPVFYREIVGGYLSKSVGEGRVMEGEVSCKSMFSRYDTMKLERIVGSSRYLNMVFDRGGDTFDFV